MTFIKHCSTSTPVPSILADTYWAGTLLPEIVMILFTQSTAVLHKYLNDELKLLCLLQFFPEFSQTSPSFPCSEKSLRIPGFTGLWMPCVKTKKHCCKVLTYSFFNRRKLLLRLIEHFFTQHLLTVHNHQPTIANHQITLAQQSYMTA